MATGKRASDGTETISASVPSELVAQIREHVGKRGFSEFVTRALKKAMVKQARLDLLADFRKHNGPLDPVEQERIRKFMRRQ